MPILDSIKDKTETVVNTVEWFAQILRGGTWVTKLLVLDVLLFFFLDPASPSSLLQYLPPQLGVPDWYPRVLRPVMGLIFLLAIIVAYRTIPSKAEIPAAFGERKAIKGLRPFDFEDSEVFARLQRETMLQECFATITDRNFRIGVLCGESGCGKTSFLQAGLWPRLIHHNHPCICIKFTELDPLDSIRLAISEKFQLPPEQSGGKDFSSLLATTVPAGSPPLILLFDQFEQLFIHHPRKEEREPFVQSLADWYKNRTLPKVKILICLREDFYGRLIELQKAMGYSLGPQQSLRLDKFTPREAASIFQVVAEIEEIPCDFQFVQELTEQELASREDGLISPVDMQILAWMIRAQKTAEERAFNRSAFQKFGGLEGLLERFLSRALQVRENETRRQAALKVLLALADLDRNARAGVLSIRDIEKKLAGSVSREEIREALDWLVRSDVRLATPIERKSTRGYELAHERLIPALRRLIGKELSATDQANRLLERRVNEWLGNQRARRYLLTWRELRLIQRQRPYLVLGKLEAEKAALLSLSQRRIWLRMASIAVPLLSILIPTAWLLSPMDLPRGVVWLAKVISSENLRRNLALDMNSEDLKRLTMAYKSTGDFEEALQKTKRIKDVVLRSQLMSAMARALALTNETDRALSFLAEANLSAQKIVLISQRNYNLSSVAVTSATIAGDLQDARFLQLALDNAKGITDPRGKEWFYPNYIAAAAIVAGKTNDVGLLRKTANIVENIPSPMAKLQVLSALAAAYIEIDRYSEDNDFVKSVFHLAESLYPLGNKKNLALNNIILAVVNIARINNDEHLIRKAQELVDYPELSEEEQDAALFSMVSNLLEIARKKTDVALIQRAERIRQRIANADLKAQAIGMAGSVYAVLSEKNQNVLLLQKANEQCAVIANPTFKDICLGYTVASTARIAAKNQNTDWLDQALQKEEQIVNRAAKDIAKSGLSEAFLRFGSWTKALQMIGEIQTPSLQGMGYVAILEISSERRKPLFSLGVRRNSANPTYLNEGAN